MNKLKNLFNKKIICIIIAVIIIITIPIIFSSHKSTEINPETYIVYITKYGKCYHNKDCYCIKSSDKIPITVKEATEKGYRPCKKCDPPVLSIEEERVMLLCHFIQICKERVVLVM